MCNLRTIERLRPSPVSVGISAARITQPGQGPIGGYVNDKD